MIGPAMPLSRLSIPGCPQCTVPVAAGAGLSMAGLAVVDLTTLTRNATAAIGLAGLVGGAVVGGIIYAINKYDNLQIERKKRYDDANKESLSAQMEESLANQKAMRESLHSLRNDASQAHAENANLRDDLATLRGQFMDVSKRLYETDIALHKAYDEMRATRMELQKTADLLALTEKDRNALRAELDVVRRQQVGQGVRLDKLEQGGSGDSHQIPRGLLDTPPHGTPAVKPPEGPR